MSLAPSFQSLEGKKNNFITAAFALTLLIHFAFSLVGITHTILDPSSFRQTQTALGAYYTIQNGFRLAYFVPVFGPPWTIPFELPLFQWIVATLVMVTRIPLDTAGRIISLLFFYAALIPGYKILNLFIKEASNKFVILSLILVNPTYLYYPRTFMIETTALCVSLCFVWTASKYLIDRRQWYLIVAAIVGTAASTIKATTFAVFLLLLLGIYLKLFLGEASSLTFAKRIKQHIIDGSILVAIPILAMLVWNNYADHLKSLNPFSSSLMSGALMTWNFGTIEQRISFAVWYQIAKYSFFIILPCVLVLSIMITCRLKHWEEAVVSFLIYLTTPLIFTNLYFIHPYYTVANILFASAVLGFFVISVSSYPRAAYRVIAVYVIFPLFLVGFYSIYLWVYFPRQVRNNTELEVIAEMTKRYTKESDVILIYNYSWFPTLPYYSQRKAIMQFDIRESIYDSKIQSVLKKLPPDQRVAAMVVFPDEKGNPYERVFIDEKINYFGFRANPVFCEDSLKVLNNIFFKNTCIYVLRENRQAY